MGDILQFVVYIKREILVRLNNYENWVRFI